MKMTEKRSIGERIRVADRGREYPLSWLFPLRRPDIGAGEIHVWLAELDKEDPTELAGILDPDEMVRAERFHFEKDRNRFIAARGLLRNFLGSYLETAPARIRFDYNPYGKPLLRKETGCLPVTFNLSHSGDVALFAFARGREVGIDLELIDPLRADEETAGWFMTPHEMIWFRVFSGSEKQTKFFFDCWTRKEAFLKALGKGLSLSPDQIGILSAEENFGLICRDEPETRASRWRFRTFSPIPGHTAALVFEGNDPDLKFFRKDISGMMVG